MHDVGAVGSARASAASPHLRIVRLTISPLPPPLETRSPKRHEGHCTMYRRHGVTRNARSTGFGEHLPGRLSSTHISAYTGPPFFFFFWRTTPVLCLGAPDLLVNYSALRRTDGFFSPSYNKWAMLASNLKRGMRHAGCDDRGGTRHDEKETKASETLTFSVLQVPQSLQSQSATNPMVLCVTYVRCKASSENILLAVDLLPLVYFGFVVVRFIPATLP